jgi:hypothetical protein
VIPPNTPLAIQPLDDQGQALQLMRTWFVGMPGENQSCTGCHESQNIVTPNKRTVAMGKAPTPITPFLGVERLFSFKYEVQPVLDRYCVGCHDGSEERKDRPNFADTSPRHGAIPTKHGNPCSMSVSVLFAMNRKSLKIPLAVIYQRNYRL